ncbi:hypothetical protein BDM02DRAFT_3091634 [Thelephora ganbajun]|uniref:Uncharacterized protein n=1 Tax=Thelephora ganbajun TaxID=370292 RepID=A0ACB6ZPL3_THEGA|nr:hypothetical protein BDM02DRAFT_3091634 [Thelephora ganbajun]
MSVLSERPPIPADTSQPALTPTTDIPITIPDVVVNGKKPTVSATLPHRRPKSSSSNHSTGTNDEWGSNFWVTLVDPQTQTQFYACPATGQVSWDPPVGSFLLPPSEDGEWWELTDDSRGGIPYYYQTKTGETVWERPDAFVIPLGILQVRT